MIDDAHTALLTTRYIFVTGGVVSSLGKGICSAALGALLKLHGYRVRIRKLDPYLNVDAGTMNPYQHGECFVTDDCVEADLDLGHYERFTGINARGVDCITAGQIYLEVIKRERKEGFSGATVQVVPHITGAIKNKLVDDTEDCDIVICEIGGTVGDIEGLPFLEAIRQMRNEWGAHCTLFIHCTLLPYLVTAGELKTKPAQHSVKELLSVGIQPDFLICRIQEAMAETERHKLAQFCNIRNNHLFESCDTNNIYAVPEMLHAQELDSRVLEYFNLPVSSHLDLSVWQKISATLMQRDKLCVTIGIVGKYIKLPDAYKSLTEALIHAGIAHQIDINIKWIDSEQIANNIYYQLDDCQGVLVPGGFGVRGTNGMINAARYARERKVPYLGICLGMQIAVIEVMRNIGNFSNAGSVEFLDASELEPVIALLNEWTVDEKKQVRNTDNSLGGTMRLGSAECILIANTKIATIYQKLKICERHRHRYEVNPKYCKQIEQLGMVFSGYAHDVNLPPIPEIIERRDHPWFIGVQYHPEFKSRPFDPHPLFISYIDACIQHERLLS